MMTESNHEPEDVDNDETRPISVAELLAKNGNIGSPPVTGRRRRRRSNSDAVTVAELTGEIPVITDDDEHDEQHEADEQNADDSGEEDDHSAEPAADLRAPAAESNGAQAAEPAEPAADTGAGAMNWFDSAPRFPKSPPQHPDSESGPKRSSYPGPMRQADRVAAEEAQARAERESSSEAIADTDAAADTGADAEAGADAGKEAEAGSGRFSLRRILFGMRVGTDTAEPATDADDDEPATEAAEPEPDTEAAIDSAAPDARRHEALAARLGRASAVVVESIMAVVLGAGLFLAFDQLWQWNTMVALVLAVLVTLGLVAVVLVVRKTPDTYSTLIAVAAGLLITFGPLVLSRSV